MQQAWTLTHWWCSGSFGLLVNGCSVCLTVGRRSFSYPRKISAPVCLHFLMFNFCFRKFHQGIEVNGGGGLISFWFPLVLCVLWGDVSSLTGILIWFSSMRRFYFTQVNWFLVISPYYRKLLLVDCWLKPPTPSLWLLTPPRATELGAKLRSSPRLEQVGSSFIDAFMQNGEHAQIRCYSEIFGAFCVCLGPLS